MQSHSFDKSSEQFGSKFHQVVGVTKLPKWQHDSNSQQTRFPHIQNAGNLRMKQRGILTDPDEAKHGVLHLFWRVTLFPLFSAWRWALKGPTDYGGKLTILPTNLG